MLREHFATRGVKVFVEVVRDTLDFSAFYTQGTPAERALDPKLGAFGYAGATGDEDDGTYVAGHAGYHLLKIARGVSPGTSVASFQPYCQPSFKTIAFSAVEVGPDCPPDQAFPCIVEIESSQAPATILLRAARGARRLAP